MRMDCWLSPQQHCTVLPKLVWMGVIHSLQSRTKSNAVSFMVIKKTNIQQGTTPQSINVRLTLPPATVIDLKPISQLKSGHALAFSFTGRKLNLSSNPIITIRIRGVPVTAVLVDCISNSPCTIILAVLMVNAYVPSFGKMSLPIILIPPSSDNSGPGWFIWTQVPQGMTI
jgi:hypothetical protein